MRRRRQTLQQPQILCGQNNRMCSQEEIEVRLRSNQIRMMEMPHTCKFTGREFDYDDLCVRAYKRAAAGVDITSVKEVRPPLWLRRSFKHLLDNVMNIKPYEWGSDDNDARFEMAERKFRWSEETAVEESEYVIYDFLLDRFRQIIAEYRIQGFNVEVGRIDSLEDLEIIEMIVRWHIVVDHQMRNSAKYRSESGPHATRDRLIAAMDVLLQLFIVGRSLPENPIISPHEPEFQAYSLILDFQRNPQSLPALLHATKPELKNSSLFNDVADIVIAYSMNRWVNFFEGFFMVPYITRCLLLPMVTSVRKKALHQIRMGSKPKINLAVLAEQLYFTDFDEAVVFFEANGLQVDNQWVFFRENGVRSGQILLENDPLYLPEPDDELVNSATSTLSIPELILGIDPNLKTGILENQPRPDIPTSIKMDKVRATVRPSSGTRLALYETPRPGKKVVLSPARHTVRPEITRIVRNHRPSRFELDDSDIDDASEVFCPEPSHPSLLAHFHSSTNQGSVSTFLSSQAAKANFSFNPKSDRDFSANQFQIPISAQLFNPIVQSVPSTPIVSPLIPLSTPKFVNETPDYSPAIPLSTPQCANKSPDDLFGDLVLAPFLPPVTPFSTPKFAFETPGHSHTIPSSTPQCAHESPDKLFGGPASAQITAPPTLHTPNKALNDPLISYETQNMIHRISEQAESKVIETKSPPVTPPKCEIFQFQATKLSNINCCHKRAFKVHRKAKTNSYADFVCRKNLKKFEDSLNKYHIAELYLLNIDISPVVDALVNDFFTQLKNEELNQKALIQAKAAANDSISKAKIEIMNARHMVLSHQYQAQIQWKESTSFLYEFGWEAEYTHVTTRNGVKKYIDVCGIRIPVKKSTNSLNIADELTGSLEFYDHGLELDCTTYPFIDSQTRNKMRMRAFCPTVVDCKVRPFAYGLKVLMCFSKTTENSRYVSMLLAGFFSGGSMKQYRFGVYSTFTAESNLKVFVYPILAPIKNILPYPVVARTSTVVYTATPVHFPGEGIGWGVLVEELQTLLVSIRRFLYEGEDKLKVVIVISAENSGGALSKTVVADGLGLAFLSNKYDATFEILIARVHTCNLDVLNLLVKNLSNGRPPMPSVADHNVRATVDRCLSFALHQIVEIGPLPAEIIKTVNSTICDLLQILDSPDNFLGTRKTEQLRHIFSKILLPEWKTSVSIEDRHDLTSKLEKYIKDIKIFTPADHSLVIGQLMELILPRVHEVCEPRFLWVRSFIIILCFIIDLIDETFEISTVLDASRVEAMRKLGYSKKWVSLEGLRCYAESISEPPPNTLSILNLKRRAEFLANEEQNAKKFLNIVRRDIAKGKIIE